jgi:hypothetical protein
VRISSHQLDVKAYNYHQKFRAISNIIMEFKEGNMNGRVDGM